MVITITQLEGKLQPSLKSDRVDDGEAFGQSNSYNITINLREGNINDPITLFDNEKGL